MCALRSQCNGIGAYENGFLAAVWLECYDLLLYFERGNGPKDGLWDQLRLAQAQEIIDRTSFLPKFGVPRRGHDHQELLVLLEGDQ